MKYDEMAQRQEEREELQKLILCGLKGILIHFTEGNNVYDMRDLINDIDDFLDRQEQY